MNFPPLRIAKKRAFPSHGNALNSIFAVFAEMVEIFWLLT